MILHKIIPAFISIAVLLAGCSVTPPIQRATEGKSEFDTAVYQGETINIEEDKSGAEQYRVYAQGATGFVPQSAVRSNVEAQANNFCAQRNMKTKIIQERKSVPPHVLGNWPRSELVFVCIEQLAKKSVDDSRYTKLENLKKLLDNGTLTNLEFESEKAKILEKSE